MSGRWTFHLPLQRAAQITGRIARQLCTPLRLAHAVNSKVYPILPYSAKARCSASIATTRPSSRKPDRLPVAETRRTHNTPLWLGTTDPQTTPRRALTLLSALPHHRELSSTSLLRSR